MSAADPRLMGARMSAVFILTRDLEAMTAFYRDVLGLRLAYGEAGQFSFFETSPGGVQIALYPGRRAEAPAEPYWFTVLDVTDIERVAASLRASGVAVSAIEDVPFGRAAQFADPEGNRIEIHQPVA